jgi:glycosyltransferase involved in cell wall biosynthesis
MVTLEAWALGKPVLVNGECDVLRGQCVRSGGGLYYENVDEFCEGLSGWKHPGDGRRARPAGRAYYYRHYAWPVIEQKYLNMLDALARNPRLPAAEPARYRRAPLPYQTAASDVLATLPSGPVVR